MCTHTADYSGKPLCRSSSGGLEAWEGGSGRRGVCTHTADYSGKPLCRARSSSGGLEAWEGGSGRRGVCMHTAESLMCSRDLHLCVKQL